MKDKIKLRGHNWNLERNNHKFWHPFSNTKPLQQQPQGFAHNYRQLHTSQSEEGQKANKRKEKWGNICACKIAWIKWIT